MTVGRDVGEGRVKSKSRVKRVTQTCPICGVLYSVPSRSAAKRRTCGRMECVDACRKRTWAKNVSAERKANGKPVLLSAWKALHGVGTGGE